MEFKYNDGGRASAGYKGNAGDCVVRAIAIVSGKPYQEVYSDLYDGIREFSKGRGRAAKRAARGQGKRGTTPRNGVPKKVYHRYLTEVIGMRWVPTMGIGTGCRVHLTEDELPGGRIICRLSKHLTAVIDGVIHDTYNPNQRSIMDERWGVGGDRCVYGYYTFD